MRKNIQIEKILPNPWRDFSLYPYDEEQIERLRTSIHDTGFWLGVQVRPSPTNPDFYETAFGHHRLEAAKREAEATNIEPIVNADVVDMDDDLMLRIMVTENATQRVNNAAAGLDSVAAITRHLGYCLLKYDEATFCGILPKVGSYGHLRGRLLNGSGLGRDAIVAYAPKDTLQRDAVNAAIGVLKDSGRLATILAEVQAQLEAEAEADRLEAEEAEREAEAEEKATGKVSAPRKARVTTTKAKAEKTTKAKTDAKVATTKATAKAAEGAPFDVRVANLFRNDHQLNVFRLAVTDDLHRQYIRLEDQYQLAQDILDYAKSPVDREGKPKKVRELTGNMIQTYVLELVAAQRGADQKDEQWRATTADLVHKARVKIDQSRNIYGAGFTDLVGLFEDDAPVPPDLPGWLDELQETFNLHVQQVRKAAGITKHLRTIEGKVK